MKLHKCGFFFFDHGWIPLQLGCGETLSHYDEKSRYNKKIGIFDCMKSIPFMIKKISVNRVKTNKWESRGQEYNLHFR